VGVSRQEYIISNEITQETGLGFRQVYPYHLEVGIEQGVLTYGIRLEYIQHEVQKTTNSNIDILRLEQVPAFVTAGLVFGTTLSFRMWLAAGYTLSDKIIVLNPSGDLSGVYEENGFMGLAGADLMFLVGNKDRQFGIVISGGYRYQDIRNLSNSSSPGIIYTTNGNSGYFLSTGVTTRW